MSGDEPEKAQVETTEIPLLSKRSEQDSELNKTPNSLEQSLN